MSFDPIAATLAYADAKNRHDVDAIVAAFAPDGIYQTAGAEPIRGHDRLRTFFTDLFEAIPDYAGAFAPPASTGSTVAAWGHFGGTLSGRFMGETVEPGRSIRIPVTFVCTFDAAGRLVSDVGYFDRAELRRQAGLPAEPSPQALDFLRRFESFWAAPSGVRVSELIAADARVHFSGVGALSGADYATMMGQALAGFDDIRVTVADYAESGDLLFIFWQATAQVGSAAKSWHGVDRFRLKDGMAIEEQVVFDPTILRTA